MFEAVTWWIIVEIMAVAALPVAAYLFRNLPANGYGLAKPLGLMLPGYAFWLLSSLGVLDNTRGSMILMIAVVAAGAWLGLGEGRREAIRLWREHRGTVLFVEVLFAFAFAIWCLVRSYNPEIAATEKPMEIAFLNGVLRSESFPPVDPWLSGYSISYYYFGYVIVAMLTRLSGVASSIAFNLAIALLFALTVIGAFTLGYSLVANRANRGRANRGLKRAAAACGLLSALFVAVMGNLEGFLELLHAHGVLSLATWQWIGIQNLDKPYLSAKWYPTNWYWWFNASRVISDVDPVTKATRDYTINEFPNFSFLLGDLHPHLLALPFTFLAMALALGIVKSEKGRSLQDLWRQPGELILWGLIIGGLGFLNSWDLPTYLIFVVLAFAVSRKLAGGEWLKESGLLALTLLVVCLVLYVPFYLGFTSQVRGIGVVLYRTKLHQFVIFWGAFLFFPAAFLLLRVGKMRAMLPNRSQVEDSSRRILRSFGIVSERRTDPSAKGPSAPVTPRGKPAGGGDSVETAALVLERPVTPVTLLQALLGDAFGVVLIAAMVLAALILLQAVVAIVMLPFIVVAALLLLRREEKDSDKSEVFVTLLVLASATILLACELFFVRDSFGNRMNTIFKEYYQVWQMLAVSGAYVVYCCARRLPSDLGILFKGSSGAAFMLAILLALASFVYPVAATITKAGEFSGQPNLDGMAFMAGGQRGDYDAINWLNQNVSGTPTILEAVGDSYSQFGRISAFTGMPTVVGWGGHELQWRGSGDESGRRAADVATIYQTTDVQLARSLLAKYQVAYVYVGKLEREKYGAGGLDKFAGFGDTVYKNDEVMIYRLK